MPFQLIESNKLLDGLLVAYRITTDAAVLMLLVEVRLAEYTIHKPLSSGIDIPVLSLHLTLKITDSFGCRLPIRTCKRFFPHHTLQGWWNKHEFSRNVVYYLNVAQRWLSVFLTLIENLTFSSPINWLFDGHIERATLSSRVFMSIFPSHVGYSAFWIFLVYWSDGWDDSICSCSQAYLVVIQPINTV